MVCECRRLEIEEVGTCCWPKGGELVSQVLVMMVLKLRRVVIHLHFLQLFGRELGEEEGCVLRMRMKEVPGVVSSFCCVPRGLALACA